MRGRLIYDDGVGLREYEGDFLWASRVVMVNPGATHRVGPDEETTTSRHDVPIYRVIRFIQEPVRESSA